MSTLKIARHRKTLAIAWQLVTLHLTLSLLYLKTLDWVIQ
jgi:hypothetical protein